MSVEQGLCSFEAHDKVFFLSTRIERDEEDATFSIKLIDSESLHAWEGELRGDHKKRAEEVGMLQEEYINQTSKALTRQNMGDLKFEYQVSSSGGNGKVLSWKKAVSSIKLQLGSVPLEPVVSSPDAMKDILLYSIEAATDLKSAICRLETENERLSSERAQALKRLERCVVQKEDMEADLYAKFATILNEKKAKIRELKQKGNRQIEAEDDDGQGQRSNQSPDTVNPQGEAEEEMEVDGDNDDDAADTDEEREKDAVSRKRQKKCEATSSRVEPEESDLFDEEPHQESSNNPRRRRRVPQMKKSASGGKPAIPKVSSGGTPSTSKTPSLTKTPSREKTQGLPASESVDDLCDQI
ncbi:uncharacterized protein [Diadema setosum]|uniref:uncharacterized protein n=1 Tax=Diadema setosum TaxID=31175 RepID=UPI003B3BC04E